MYSIYRWSNACHRADIVVAPARSDPTKSGKTGREVLFGEYKCREDNASIFNAKLNDFYTRDPDARTTGSAAAAASRRLAARLPPPLATTVHNP